MGRYSRKNLNYLFNYPQGKCFNLGEFFQPQEVGGWRADAPKKVFNPDSIRTTKQFKVLMDMGWHAEEAEFALRLAQTYT